jgi:thiamine transport system substrate-binding protein
MEAFTRQTGYSVRVVPSGDAGTLSTSLALTKGDPVADLVYGIDNTFASRAVAAGALTAYEPTTNPGDAMEPMDPQSSAELTPIDYSDVCVNIDDTWFAAKGLRPPATFEDLADPRYKGLFVTPAPTSSSPGMAFLLATIAEFGEDGWVPYWIRLIENDVKITSGWSDAYQVDFTAGGGSGERPIVLSYASSPPITIPEGDDKPTSSALLDTCFRQVEYAGVLKGADNIEGARQFINFMVGTEFQEAIPDQMYVFPADPAATLPENWARYAIPAPQPRTITEGTIDERRAEWLTSWSDIPR